MKVKVHIMSGNVAVRCLDSNGKLLGDEARHTPGTESGDFIVSDTGRIEIREISQDEMDGKVPSPVDKRVDPNPSKPNPSGLNPSVNR